MINRPVFRLTGVAFCLAMLWNIAARRIKTPCPLMVWIAYSMLMTLAFTPATVWADTAADTVVERVLSNRLSDGFAARMQIAANDSKKHRLPPFKVSIIGQTKRGKQRVLLQGISPGKLRDTLIAADCDDSGKVVARRSEEHRPYQNTDAHEPLFNSNLVLWDLLAPWWQWPEQSIIGSDTVDDHTCTQIESRQSIRAGPVSRVISCVEANEAFAWRTELFTPDDKLLRTITVQNVMRTEQGRLAAKQLRITQADGSQSDVTVYSGDESYAIGDDTFTMLDTVSP